MNICFVANKHLTIYFAEIAGRLEKKAHPVFWLSPSTRWTNWLVAHGTARERILNMPDFALEWTNAKDTTPSPELVALEAPNRPTIANLILMCRALNRLPKAKAYAYLEVCQRHIEPFLRRNDIKVCFGEPTWGFELISWMVCRKLGLRYLHPTTVRIPEKRFAFFDAIPHQVTPYRTVTEEDRSWARTFLAQWRNRPRKPVLTAQLAAPHIFQSHWHAELAASWLRHDQDRGDLTLWPMRARVHSRLKKLINLLIIGRASPFSPPVENEPFVLMCLHVQPENSIDVLGVMHSNQYQAVERIARLLPATHKLWVKEHPDGLGSRPRTWLKRLGDLPNVRLIDPVYNTFELIRRAAMVISTTGTVSLEACLLGKSSATLSPIYFSPLLAIDSTKYRDPLDWPLWETLRNPASPEVLERKAEDYMAWLHAQSFEGMPYDPVTLQHAGRKAADFDREAEAFASFLAWPDLTRSAIPDKYSNFQETPPFC
ncbi:MAG TPA: hypothetical protein VJ476_03405 [Rhizomicrobium sp.]|nr:hypothetical protein [Rhizomicrobium sp.]